MLSGGANGSFGGVYNNVRIGFKRQRTQADLDIPMYYPDNNNNVIYGNYNIRAGAFPYNHSGGALPYSGRQPRVFPAVRLRGLPFNCRESDVIEFFKGLDVVDVVLVKRGGRFSGEAFVVFGAPAQVDFALRRDRQNIGRRYIEVFRCRKQDYYQAIASDVKSSSDSKGTPDRRHENNNNIDNNNDNNVSSAPKNNDEDNSKNVQKDADTASSEAQNGGVLRLRGLPSSVSKKDILDFFGDYELCEEKVRIVRNSDECATGEGFVEFASVEDSKAAMSKDKMMIGTRCVELLPSTQEEAGRAACEAEQSIDVP